MLQISRWDEHKLYLKKEVGQGNGCQGEQHPGLTTHKLAESFNLESHVKFSIKLASPQSWS